MAKRKREAATKEEPDVPPPVNRPLDEQTAEQNGQSAKKKRKVKQSVRESANASTETNGGDIPPQTTKSTKRKRPKSTVKEEKDEQAVERSSVKQGREKKKDKQPKQADEDEAAEAGDAHDKPAAKKKRKTKEEKEAEAMPLAPRTAGHKLFIGAHVSASGGVQNAVSNSVHIGANAFALFLKSQRKWANPPLAADQCTTFHGNCKSHTYDQSKHVVPHGSYLVNLAHTDKARTEQAFESFLDDLKRCERLGIKLYNFHPGVANSTGGDRQAAIKHLASNINRAHKETESVVTLLENMAHGGNTLGSTFEDLRDIVALIQEKDRVGVCLDTCHAFAGGYDLRTPDAFKKTTDQFEKTVGFKYLRALHMNDSKAPFASHRDLHANIGTGFLGLRSFHNIVNDSRFEGLPLILETPLDATNEDGVPVKDEKGKVKEDKGIWAREIKLLESLVGMDAEGEEFRRLEKALARKGEPERRKMEQQIEKKREKDEKKSANAKKKSKKGQKAKVESEDEGEESALSVLESEGER